MISKGRKVVVTGFGGVFPTCKSSEEFAQKLFNNQSLIRRWDKAMSYGKQIRSVMSAYIDPLENDIEPIYNPYTEDYPEIFVDHLNRIPPNNLATADLGSIWAMLATQDAIKMAGWTHKETTSEQTGVVMSSASGGNEVTRTTCHQFYVHGKKTRSVGVHTVERAMVYREAANVSCLIKNKGVVEAVASACATGLGNIGYAYRLIKFGLQDRVVTGGIEGTALETFIGFDGMQILSRGFEPHESSRPFAKDRNGFVCSFGAGIVCLEEYEIAKSRGANIIAVIDEYFNNSDGDGDMFAPSFDGQIRLWNGLMKDINFKPDVVKVHGTSTFTGDPIELFSVTEFLGNSGYHISAPKSQFGHMLGAAGAVEFITALLMLQNQKVLPCLNSEELNDELEGFQLKDNWNGPKNPVAYYRDLLPLKTFEKEINHIVCLNYGFGGTNSAMMISKDI
ncbi:MAG: beta-ketoacyl-[acyl-carrier-protein] synthase family protein [Sphingobacteriales bacterium]|nr:beta-ketoacyl-[acyl-carrier-protein] synthase family protein [Sphingobacteriales bacterium]